jgi:ABC-2 type transport system ATP-binding protein
MTTLLSAEHVHVEFGTLVAVRDTSFDLAGGQLLGLVGPNGAGKTTLMRVLAGLHAPTRGIARILGKPVLGEHEVVRHHVGFAPDTPPAYEELTVDEFLHFIAGAYRLDPGDAGERIDFWLEQLWLTDKRTTQIKNLSRGMRQRVTLARTFVPRPHVLLLDEPLSGLDPAGRIQLRSVLGMLRDQGCAMIVSSHILSDLEEVATHIAIIEQGSILRWCEAEAFRQGHATLRTYRIEPVPPSDGFEMRLGAIDGVDNVQTNGRGFQFDYHADESQAAELLAALVRDGVPIISFGPVRTTLEDAYLKSGVKQVD